MILARFLNISKQLMGKKFEEVSSSNLLMRNIKIINKFN